MRPPKHTIGDVVVSHGIKYWVTGVLIHAGYDNSSWSYHLSKPTYGDADKIPHTAIGCRIDIDSAPKPWVPEHELKTTVEALEERRIELDRQIIELAKEKAELERQRNSLQ